MTAKIRVDRLLEPVPDTEAPYRLVLEYLPSGSPADAWMAALALGFDSEIEREKALNHLNAATQRALLVEHG